MTDEAALLRAELHALMTRVNVHWQSYITTRLDAAPDDIASLQRAIDWTHQNAEIAPKTEDVK